MLDKCCLAYLPNYAAEGQIAEERVLMNACTTDSYIPLTETAERQINGNTCTLQGVQETMQAGLRRNYVPTFDAVVRSMPC